MSAELLAEGAVAAFTGLLAWMTYKLARETQEMVRSAAVAAAQADAHHQETMQPLVRVDASCVVDADDRAIVLAGRIVNSGNGPATHVTLRVDANALPPREMYLGTLGANNFRPLAVRWAAAPGTGPAAGAALPFRVAVEYRNLFGATGHTRQSSETGLAEDLADEPYELPPIRPRG